MEFFTRAQTKLKMDQLVRAKKDLDDGNIKKGDVGIVKGASIVDDGEDQYCIGVSWVNQRTEIVYHIFTKTGYAACLELVDMSQR